MNHDQSRDNINSNQRAAVFSTVSLLLGVGLVVGGLMLLYHIIGISVSMTAFGSLFLLYWAGILHQAWREFLPSVIGGTLGIALAWLLLEGAAKLGLAGIVGGPAILITALFFYLRGELHMTVNNGTMLFLLVATIPDLGVNTNATTMVLSLAIGAAWIGVVSYIASQVRSRWNARAQ